MTCSRLTKEEEETDKQGTQYKYTEHHEANQAHCKETNKHNSRNIDSCFNRSLQQSASENYPACNVLTTTLIWWPLCFANAIRLTSLYSRFSRQPWKLFFGFWESNSRAAPILSCMGTKTHNMAWKKYIWFVNVYARSGCFNNDVLVCQPAWSSSGWTLQGSEPSLCVYPQWGWGESCVAPATDGASADHLTGCRERWGVGVLRSCLETMMMRVVWMGCKEQGRREKITETRRQRREGTGLDREYSREQVKWEIKKSFNQSPKVITPHSTLCNVTIETTAVNTNNTCDFCTTLQFYYQIMKVCKCSNTFPPQNTARKQLKRKDNSVHTTISVRRLKDT